MSSQLEGLCLGGLPEENSCTREELLLFLRRGPMRGRIHQKERVGVLEGKGGSWLRAAADKRERKKAAIS